MVSRQPSPESNKQPQWYESLPDGLTVPTSTFFHKYFLLRGLLSSPTGNSRVYPTPCGSKMSKAGSAANRSLCREAEGMIQKSERVTMQSQNMTLLVHANLGPQMYCYYFGIRGFKIYKHKYRSDRETKRKHMPNQVKQLAALQSASPTPDCCTTCTLSWPLSTALPWSHPLHHLWVRMAEGFHPLSWLPPPFPHRERICATLLFMNWQRPFSQIINNREERS